LFRSFERHLNLLFFTLHLKKIYILLTLGSALQCKNISPVETRRSLNSLFRAADRKVKNWTEQQSSTWRSLIWTVSDMLEVRLAANVTRMFYRKTRWHVSLTSFLQVHLCAQTWKTSPTVEGISHNSKNLTTNTISRFFHLFIIFMKKKRSSWSWMFFQVKLLRWGSCRVLMVCEDDVMWSVATNPSLTSRVTMQQITFNIIFIDSFLTVWYLFKS